MLVYISEVILGKNLGAWEQERFFWLFLILGNWQLLKKAQWFGMSAHELGKDSLERFTARIIQCTSIMLKQANQMHTSLFCDMEMGQMSCKHTRTRFLLVGLSVEIDTSKISLGITSLERYDYKHSIIYFASMLCCSAMISICLLFGMWIHSYSYRYNKYIRARLCLKANVLLILLSFLLRLVMFCCAHPLAP